MEDPSIQDNPLCKQCNTSTCYAAPVMQPHLLCKHLHHNQLLCRTYNATHLLCETPAASFPPMSRSLLETPTEYARTQTRNLSKFRPNFSLNFRHKPT